MDEYRTLQKGPRPPQKHRAPFFTTAPRRLQEASRRPKRPPRRPQEAPEIVQEGLETHKDRSKTPKMVPRRPKRPPRRPKRPPRGFPRGPRESNVIVFSTVFAGSPPTLRRGSRLVSHWGGLGGYPEVVFPIGCLVLSDGHT